MNFLKDTWIMVLMWNVIAAGAQTKYLIQCTVANTFAYLLLECHIINKAIEKKKKNSSFHWFYHRTQSSAAMWVKCQMTGKFAVNSLFIVWPYSMPYINECLGKKCVAVFSNPAHQGFFCFWSGFGMFWDVVGPHPSNGMCSLRSVMLFIVKLGRDSSLHCDKHNENNF